MSELVISPHDDRLSLCVVDPGLRAHARIDLLGKTGKGLTRTLGQAQGNRRAAEGRGQPPVEESGGRAAAKVLGRDICPVD